MRKFNLLLTVSLLVIPALVLLSGCQEKQALDENIRLKTELANLDKIIFSQMESLEKCGEEKKQIQQRSGQVMEPFMDLFEKLNTKAIQLEKENEALRNEIEKFKKL